MFAQQLIQAKNKENNNNIYLVLCEGNQSMTSSSYIVNTIATDALVP